MVNSGYVQIPTGKFLVGDFTVAVWIKPSTVSSALRYLCLIGQVVVKFSINGFTPPGPYFFTPSVNKVSNQALVIGKWSHLTFTMKSSILSIYIDGG
jgi:hypothetical protein